MPALMPQPDSADKAILDSGNLCSVGILNCKTEQAMRTSAITIFIAVLFSFNAFAENNPGVPPDGTNVTKQATPLESAVIPNKEKSAPAAATASPSASPSPSQPPSPPKTVPLSQKLEQPLLELTDALTKFVKKQSEPENVATTILDFLIKLVALIAAIVGCYISYKGIKKIPWFKEHQDILVTILTVILLIVSSYLLSGLVTSVLYVLIAILILLIALLVAGAHLMEFIDAKYPDVRDDIVARFSESSTSKSADKLVRGNVRNIFDWLSNIVFVQGVNGNTQLKLTGSFVDGFDTSIFEIEADDRVLSHWENFSDRMLIPVKVNLRLVDSRNGQEAQLVNIQIGLVVVRLNNELQFKKFSNEGFQQLGDALVEWWQSK